MQATIPIINTDLCWHRYYNISDSHPAKGFAIIDDGVLCAAAEEGGRDTCAVRGILHFIPVLYNTSLDVKSKRKAIF